MNHDLSNLSEEELAEVKQQILAQYEHEQELKRKNAEALTEAIKAINTTTRFYTEKYNKPRWNKIIGKRWK